MLAHDTFKAQGKALSRSFRALREHETSQGFHQHVPASTASYTQSIFLFLMLVAGFTYQSALRARADENERSLKIMTQNVDAGTDFGYLTGASSAAAFAQGVVFTYEEINASNIVPRAALLALEIALNRPALVGLQEVNYMADGIAPSISSTAVSDGGLVRSTEVVAR